MTVKPIRTTPTQGARVDPRLSQAREEALFKLIQVEPDHFCSLVRSTGWGEEQTRMALQRLTAAGKIQKHNRSGRQFFVARVAFSFTPETAPTKAGHT